MNCRHCNTRMGWVAGNLVCINQACTINTPTTTSGTTGDTPRTDAAAVEHLLAIGQHVPADYARQLERELNEARRELAAFARELGCADLTPSGNVVLAMVRLKEIQARLAEVTAKLTAAERELNRHQPQLCDEILAERNYLRARLAELEKIAEGQNHTIESQDDMLGWKSSIRTNYTNWKAAQ